MLDPTIGIKVKVTSSIPSGTIVQGETQLSCPVGQVSEVTIKEFDS